MRRPSSTLILFLVVSLLLSIVSNIASSIVPGWAQPYLWLAWPAVAILAVLAVFMEGRYRRLPDHNGRPNSEDSALDSAAGKLAAAVRGQWQAEIEVRGLLEPWPIEVHWSSPRNGDLLGASGSGQSARSAPAHSVLGPSVLGPSVLGPSVLGPSVLGPSVLGPSVLGPSVLGPSVPGPSAPGRLVSRVRRRGLRRVWHTRLDRKRTRAQDDFCGIVGFFEQLPQPQLLVLGDKGAGKTVLAMLLTTGLLARRRRRRPCGPVPVLLSLSSWNPTREHLAVWIEKRLLEEYPALGSPEFGPDAAARLVAEGRILPILDGLDEVAQGFHIAAIVGIERAVGGARPVVVTCRTPEYREAVRQGGRALSAFPIELEPVGVREAIEFLSHGAGEAVGRWARVFAQMRAHPQGHVAKALSAPLMVSLARSVHTDPARNPGELCDRVRLPDRAAIEHHLLEAFIPAVYTNHPQAWDGGARRSRPPRRYTVPQATRWLTFLARHQSALETRDLVWWRLCEAIPPRRLRWAGGLLLALADAVVCAAAVGLGAGWAGAAAGIGGALAYSMTMTLLIGPPGQPRQINRRIRGTRPRLGQELAMSFAVGLAVGVTIGLGVSPAAGFAVGMTAFILVGVVGGLAQWLNSPADAVMSPSPASVLRHDKYASIMRILAVEFGALLGTGYAASTAGGGHLNVGIGLAAGILGGFAAGLAAGKAGGVRGGLANCFSASAWGWFVLCRYWLALRGDLPWRLSAFLDDAHQRGVLRQSGAAHQFRHERLHDHLAGGRALRPAPMPDSPSTPAGGAAVVGLPAHDGSVAPGDAARIRGDQAMP